MARKEISLLLEADAHPCVVRFFVKEKDDTFDVKDMIKILNC